MSEQSNPAFEKTRDEALRALLSNSGLTPDQVATLKLSQVHLASSTLLFEPDEFDLAAAGQPPTRIKLDDTTQRALIAWLVVRPDSPNSHLFPGDGMEGLDVKTISQVLAAAKPAEVPPPPKAEAVSAPLRDEGEKPRGIPAEPISRRPREVKQEPPPSPPVAPRSVEPEPVSLDEIEALRKRLTQAYDAWAPVVPPRQAPAPESPPLPPIEARPGARPTLPESAPVPTIPPLPVSETEAAMESRAEETPVEQPWPEEIRLATAPRPERAPLVKPAFRPPGEPGVPGEAMPDVTMPGAMGGRVKGLWKAGAENFTLNISYRSAALAGIGLLLAVCGVGLGLAGGMLLGGDELPALLAGATPTHTPIPTPAASATFTPAPSPTPTATASPTSTSSPTSTASPTPTLAAPTVGPTPTPIVIVVTATPTPEPPATATPAPTRPPQSSAPRQPTATPAPTFKYPAPVLLEPPDGAQVPGVINILKWQPVGPLDDNEWYAVRLVFLRQGQPVYEGDRVKVPEWRVADRLYYQADGPELQYKWFVFVERDNPDGSTTQQSPESKTFTFRWD